MILVTGGTGLVGNNVIRQLLDAGHAVRALVRHQSPTQPLEGLAVETAVGDLSDLDSLTRAMAGVDCVIHSAGMVKIGWSMDNGMVEANVHGTRHVAEAALRAGARMVHVSSVDSLAVPRDPQGIVDEDTPLGGNEVASNYVLTKRDSDRMVDQAIQQGLDAVRVHPGFMLGPWDWKPSSGRMLMAVATQFTPLAPAGGGSVCDVRDVARAIVRLATGGCQHRSYILAGHNMTYFDLWTLMARVTGSRPPLAKMGPLICHSVGWVGDVWARISGTEGDINSATLAMSRQFHYYDSRRAEQELGYTIRDTETSIADAWQWLQNRRG